MVSNVARVLVLAVAGCAGATSGETHPGSPPVSHTVQGTGPVDNAGRTSDETVARPETSGVRPTELGADRPTGTNTGVPVGARTRPAVAPNPLPRRALMQPRERDSPVASYADEPGRAEEAYCDREKACGRVGAGRAYESALACIDATRGRFEAELGAMACTLDRNAFATCLASIHAAPCAQPLDRLGSVSECSSAAMCASH